MTKLLAVSLIHLARFASFNISPDGIAHTFPDHHRSHGLFETHMPRVLEVVVISTDCLGLVL
jgi:hypothetical protein